MMKDLGGIEIRDKDGNLIGRRTFVSFPINFQTTPETTYTTYARAKVPKVKTMTENFSNGWMYFWAVFNQTWSFALGFFVAVLCADMLYNTLRELAIYLWKIAVSRWI